MKLLLPFLSLGLLELSLAASPSEWRSRIIYQVLTDRYARPDGSTTASCNVANKAYCGGTWKGLISKLPYIKNMGFTAIWISPITAQMMGQTSDGSSYHGYWQSDINSLNSKFGSASDLKALASAVHSAGMLLMVDVVPNHFAWNGGWQSVDYTAFSPFNDAGSFHPFCAITDADYTQNQTAVEDCWITGSSSTGAALVDVNTNDQDIMNTFYSWIGDLVSTYGIDGLRIDSVKNVQTGFWPGFNSAAGVYCVGEVSDGDPTYTLPYQNQLDGVLNYPLYYPLVRAFSSTSGSMSDLANMVNTIKSSTKDATLLGTFLENHDNPRFPSYTSDMVLAQNGIAFTLLADGIPIVFEGQEQHFDGGNDPYNREAVWTAGYDTTAPLYGFIANVNDLRNRAMAQDANYVEYMAYPIYTDTTTIAMRKGFDGYQVVGVFSNKGANGAAYSQVIPNTGFTQGESVVEIIGCTTSAASSGGNLTVAMGKGAPKIFYPKARLSGSGICGN